MPSILTVNVGAAVACLLLLGYGFFLEHVEGLAPCPLCSVQRAVFALLALVLLASVVHRPRSRGGARTYGIAAGLVAAVGAGIAGWHVRLQNLPPDQAPECGPGLGYLLDTFPLGEAISMIFTGSGECAEVSWTFLSLSIPGWALVWFLLLGTVAVANSFRSPRGFRPRIFN